MIRACEAAEFLEAVKDYPFLAGRMQRLCRCYGETCKLAEMYRTQHSAMICTDSGTLLFCDPQEEELFYTFLSFRGTPAILTNLDSGLFADWDKEELCVMRQQTAGRKGPCRLLRPEELLHVWREKQGEERDELLSDLMRRFHQGFLTCYGLETEHGIKAVIAAEQSGRECYLSFLHTCDEETGKGYASRLLQQVMALHCDTGCYLVCEQRLRPFYEKNGFAACGRQWRYTRRNL